MWAGDRRCVNHLCRVIRVELRVASQATQSGTWVQLLPHFDLPEQYIQANGQPQMTHLVLQQYYTVLLAPFEEAWKKNMARSLQAARNQQQASQLAGAQGRQVQGNFPAVGSLPAMQGQNGLGMMGQPGGGSPAQPADPSFGAMNGMQFSNSQGPSMPQHQMQQNINGAQELAEMARLNGLAPSTSQSSDLNGAATEQEEGRKRKLEEADDGKRAKHKSGGTISSFVATGLLIPFIAAR